MKRLMFLLLLAFTSFNVMQAEQKEWAMKTNTGDVIAMADVDYLLAADDERVFSIILKNGATIENVEEVTFSDVTAVTSIEADGGLSLFPNPVKESITITGCKEGSVINILSLDGRVVKTAVMADNSMTIRVDELVAGCYLLQTNNTVVKFIKK